MPRPCKSIKSSNGAVYMINDYGPITGSCGTSSRGVSGLEICSFTEIYWHLRVTNDKIQHNF